MRQQNDTHIDIEFCSALHRRSRLKNSKSERTLRQYQYLLNLEFIQTT